MKQTGNKQLTRLEVLMGVALMAALGLALMPHVRTVLFEEPGQRAGTLAGELAHALTDFHRETGAWPVRGGADLDLTVLAAPAAAAGATTPPGMSSTRPLVPEIPLDPWGRPFRAVLLADGRGVAVISAGPDGEFATSLERLWGRRGVADAFDGDDAGFVLALPDPGGGP
jgi:hypothetical protein